MFRSLSRRSFLAHSLAALGVGVLAACRPAATPAPTEAAAAPEKEKEVPPTAVPEPEAELPAAIEPTGIQWGLAYDPHVEAYERLANLFEEQTGSKLEVQPMPGGELLPKLTANVAAGTPPDLVCIMGKNSMPLYLQQMLVPLRDSVYDIKGFDPEKDFIAADAWQQYTWEGEIYGVPTEFNRVGSCVNVPTDDVRELGLEELYPPTNGEIFFESFEDMWQLASELQIEESDGTVARWGLSSQGWEDTQYLGILRTLLEPKGMEWWDSDNKQFNVNTEEGVRAMGLQVQRAVDLGIETKLTENSVNAALAGKVALARGNRTPTTTGRDVGLVYYLAGCPKIDGREPLFIGEGGWGFVAPTRSASPNLALEYLRMLLTDEAQIEYSKIYNGSPPPVKSLVDSREYYKDPSDESPNVIVGNMLVYHLGPRTVYYGEGFGYSSEISGIFGEGCDLVRVGDMSPEEACEHMQSRLEMQRQEFVDEWGEV